MTMRFSHSNRKRRPGLITAAFLLAMFAAGGAVWACADSSCDPDWRLDAAHYDCAGRATLNPGNDTRINMLWLMRSLAAVPLAESPPQSVDDRQFGQTFLSWTGLRAALWPQPAPSAPTIATADPTCEASVRGVPAFSAAITSEPNLPTTERALLEQWRAKLGCEAMSWDAGAITSRPGRDYLAYLKSAEAFYADDWTAAKQGFASLTRSKTRWVAETAAYMPIRIGLRSAVAMAVDDYGDFSGTDKVDAKAVNDAREAITAYLKAYPKGRYARSAQGLMRRIYWLSGDTASLVRTYELLLSKTPGTEEAAADLAEEIDIKLLERPDVGVVLDRLGEVPLLLAIADLKRMRHDFDDDGKLTGRLTAAELAGQTHQFATHPDLVGLLAATRTYYADEDPKTILTLLPDDARAARYTPLAFSRQMLRGMALAKAKDPNEAGFWQALMGGASPFYQKPLVQLGLAIRWQKDGKLGQIFAASSPITDSMTREILLQTLAPSGILRSSATDASRPMHERDIARFTLLYKNLSHGAFVDFGRDLALVRARASTEAGLWDFSMQDEIPVSLFTQGKWSDGSITCAELAQTVATLARSPADRKAQLCLGEFYRLNGFDGFALSRPDMDHDILGLGPDGFTGKPRSRSDIYLAIIADKRAAPDERAYALYRAVMCYAPAGYNGCAGPASTGEEMAAAQAPPSDRKGWFSELKQRYPNSRWAKSLRYYW